MSPALSEYFVNAVDASVGDMMTLAQEAAA